MRCIPRDLAENAVEIADGIESAFDGDLAHSLLPFLNERHGLLDADGIEVGGESDPGHPLEIIGEISGREPHESRCFLEADIDVILFDFLKKREITRLFRIRFFTRISRAISQQNRYRLHDFCVAKLFVERFFAFLLCHDFFHEGSDAFRVFS